MWMDDILSETLMNNINLTKLSVRRGVHFTEKNLQLLTKLTEFSCGGDQTASVSIYDLFFINASCAQIPNVVADEWGRNLKRLDLTSVDTAIQSAMVDKFTNLTSITLYLNGYLVRNL